MPDSVPTKKGKTKVPKTPHPKKSIEMHTLKKGKNVRTESPGTKGPKMKSVGRKFGKQKKAATFPFQGASKPGVSAPRTHADRELKKMTKGEY